MQLFALDSDKKLVFAEQAAKQCDYMCIECNQAVRVRGGPHRQTHYYHLVQSHCRQSEKSMQHIQAQLYLFDLLPKDEVQLEMRFPQINRIADVVWTEKRLIFEIQCSPISASEVMERNSDYGAQGYQVVWILHDNRFNQWRLSAAEQFLRGAPYYFTNINAEGKGVIYDQFDITLNGLRKHMLFSLPVSLDQPLSFKNHKTTLLKPIPKAVQQRISSWPMGFKGDLVDSCFSLDNSDYLGKMLKAEAEMAKLELSSPELSWRDKLQYYLWYSIVRPYRLLFQILLERSCK